MTDFDDHNKMSKYWCNRDHNEPVSLRATGTLRLPQHDELLLVLVEAPEESLLTSFFMVNI